MTTVLKPGDRLRYIGENERLVGWVLEVKGLLEQKPWSAPGERWECEWIEHPSEPVLTMGYNGKCYISDGFTDIDGLVIFERIEPDRAISLASETAAGKGGE